ncbi:unnamed protein product [Arabidopsis halleri]
MYLEAKPRSTSNQKLLSLFPRRFSLKNRNLLKFSRRMKIFGDKGTGREILRAIDYNLSDEDE